MSFGNDIRIFTKKVNGVTNDVFVNTVSHVHQSIVDGSAVTGAPGSPVDTGNLRDSWQIEFESPTSALVATNVEYAQAVEDNARGVTFRNHGAHSVKLTRAGFDKIVAYEVAQARGNG